MSVNKILSQLENTHLYLMKEIQVTALCYNSDQFPDAILIWRN